MPNPPPSKASADLQATAARAVADHRAGRLDAAEQGYRDVLARTPGNADITNNLAVLWISRNAFDKALALLEPVVAASPGDVRAWQTHLAALIGLGEFDRGLAAVTQRRAAGDVAAADEGEQRLRQAWAIRLMAAGQAAAAETHLRRVVEIAPQSPVAHADLGRVLAATGRLEAALASLRHALALAPDHLPALLNLAQVLEDLGQPAAAEDNLRRVLALQPGHGHALRNLRVLLVGQERHADALAAADNAIAAGFDIAEAHVSRGAALAGLGRNEEALAAFEAALARGHDRCDVLTRIGTVQGAMGLDAAALASLDAAIALRPQDPAARLKRALLRLRQGDFAGGWPDYEFRWRNEVFRKEAGWWPPALIARLQFNPTPEQVAGRRVLTFAEQGIGDQVMFASLLPDLSGEAAAVTCVCEPRLVRLFSSSFPDVSVLSEKTAKLNAGDFDAFVALGSLAGLYRRDVAAFPGKPYLRPRAEVRDAWRERLGPARGLRVGISWRGGAAKTRQGMRSMDLARLTPILDLPGCEFVSLQYGDVTADVAAANGGRPNAIRLFPRDDIDDFEDLAALVANLDLVVSVQTALVHLTGAVGTDAIVFVPHDAEWRYGSSGSAMPWYGSVELIRQQADRDWAPAIARARDLVTARAAAWRAPGAP